MSTISVITNPGSNFSVKLCTWPSLVNGDAGAPLQFTEWADRAMQVYGTFGVGGTIVWEGSNDQVAWSTLTDASGVGMSYTAAALKQMTEAPIWVRPRVTAGDGTTALVASIAMRRLTTSL